MPAGGAAVQYRPAFHGANSTGPLTRPDVTELAAFVEHEWMLGARLRLTLGARYEFQSFALPETRNTNQELLSTGVDTGTLPNDWDNLGPRAGLTWSLDPRTVLRAGYGLCFGRTPALAVAAAHAIDGVNSTVFALTGRDAPQYPARFASTAELPAGRSPQMPSLFVFDRGFESPQVHQASASLERTLGGGWGASLGYLFAAGRRLPRPLDANVEEPEAVAVPIQGGGVLQVQRFPSEQPYDEFNRIVRFERHLQARLSYTLAKRTDTGPAALAVTPQGFDDARFASSLAAPDAARAPADDDRRHRLVASGFWDAGEPRQGPWLVRALRSGWSLAWVAAAESGRPHSQRVSGDLNNDRNPANDIVPGGRNAERLPARFSLDLRLGRRIALGDRLRLELAAHALNLFDNTRVAARQDVLYAHDAASDRLTLRLTFGADTLFLPRRSFQFEGRLGF